MKVNWSEKLAKGSQREPKGNHKEAKRTDTKIHGIKGNQRKHKGSQKDLHETIE